MRIQDEIHELRQIMKKFADVQVKTTDIMEDLLSRVVVLESVVFEQVTEKDGIVKFRPTETDSGAENSENP